MYSISHPNPSIGEELSSAQAMSDGRRAGFGRTSAAIVPIAVVVRAVFQVGVIVKPMAMSMNLIMVIGVIAVLPYLTIGFSRRCSERFPTSRRAVQLDLISISLTSYSSRSPGVSLPSVHLSASSSILACISVSARRGTIRFSNHRFYPILTLPLSWVSAYSTSCLSGFVPSALAQMMLRMTSGSPTPNDQRMPKCSAT